MITATTTAAPVVNRKVTATTNKSQANYAKLDTKARAYIGLWEKSDVSPEACALFEYLKCRQGAKSHCFPSRDELCKRLRWHHRKLRRVCAELEAKLPEVFEVVKGVGKQANSYRVKGYRDWPESLCERLWFPSGASVARQCGATVATQPTSSGATVAALHGIVYGEGDYGTGETELEPEIDLKQHFCSNCGLGGAEYHLGGDTWLCGRESQCYSEWMADTPF